MPTPSFSGDLAVPELTFGTADTWTLPEIRAGLFPMSEVRFEASTSLQSYFSFDEIQGSVYFNGGHQESQSQSVFGEVRFRLIDDQGNE